MRSWTEKVEAIQSENGDLKGWNEIHTAAESEMQWLGWERVLRLPNYSFPNYDEMTSIFLWNNSVFLRDEYM